MTDLQPLFNLALKADVPGLIGPIDRQLALLTHKFTSTPALLGNTTAGAVAVNYLANSLLAQGATPRYLTLCFTVNSATGNATIERLAESTSNAAVQAEAEIAAVDAVQVGTDLPANVQLAITGLGQQRPDTQWGPQCLRSGDAVIITGPVGAHGAALAQARAAGMDTPAVESDTHVLDNLVHALQNTVPSAIRMMDYPFGGFNASVQRIENLSGAKLKIDHEAIPVEQNIRQTAAVMGISPLKLETAGAMLVIVAPEMLQQALGAIKRSQYGQQAAAVGTVL